MSSLNPALLDSSSGMKEGSVQARFFSAFAIALGLSLIAGYLSPLRELPSGDFHAEWGALVFFCCAAGLLVAALPRRFAVNPLLFLLPAVLAVLIAVQLSIGSYGDWQTPAFWLGYLLLAVLALVLGQGIRAAGLTVDGVDRIAWALLAAALLNCAAQVLQAAHQPKDFTSFLVPLLNCRPYGNIGQSNHAATLAWLGMASTLYLYGCRRLPSPLALPVIALLLVSAALTASRMNWLLLLVAVAAVIWLPAWPGGDRRQRLVTVGILVSGFLVASIGTGAVFERLGPTCASGLDRLVAPSDGGIDARLQFWKQAVDVWLTSPWIGVGAYRVAPTLYVTEALDAYHGLDMYSHNAVLQILAEFGLAGAGALLAAVMVLARWVTVAHRQLTPPDALLLLLLGTIATHSMLEYPLWYTHFLILFCLALGLLVRPDWARRPLMLSLRLPLLAMAAALLVAAGFLFNDYRNLDRLVWMEIYRRQMSAAPTPEVRARIEDALADVHLFRVKAEFVAALSEPLSKDDLPKKIAAADRLLKKELFPPLIGRRIALAILSGDEETARLHFRRLLVFFPRQVENISGPLRELAQKRPDDFAALGPILDEELARRNKPRIP